MAIKYDPPQFPADWAVAWGQDAYGFWQALEIKDVRQIMRWIEPGEFWMGSPEQETNRQNDEVHHRVSISQGYWLAEAACSQALWQAVCGQNPSHFDKGGAWPVEQVSWDDCQAWITQANLLIEGGFSLRLPTEAEWEYACRAGTQTAFSSGDNLTTEQANYDGNYPYQGYSKGIFRQETVKVRDFAPNPWGLYQMHGNVWEWCEDAYHQDASETLPDQSEGDGSSRVLRGGSWFSDAQDLRSAYRNRYAPGLRSHYIGLRLAGG